VLVVRAAERQRPTPSPRPHVALRSSWRRPLRYPQVLCAALGVALPYIGPLARLLGFRPLPLSFLAVLAGMIVTYLALAQLGVALFFSPRGGRPLSGGLSRHERRVGRRASRWGMLTQRDHRSSAPA
jgi:P-type Mg2+ transporter